MPLQPVVTKTASLSDAATNATITPRNLAWQKAASIGRVLGAGLILLALATYVIPIALPFKAVLLTGTTLAIICHKLKQKLKQLENPRELDKHIFFGQPTLVKWDLFFGADPNGPVYGYQNISTPFHTAAKEGKAEMIKMLLDYNANPNICTVEETNIVSPGYSPLMALLNEFVKAYESNDYLNKFFDSFNVITNHPDIDFETVQQLSPNKPKEQPPKAQSPLEYLQELEKKLEKELENELQAEQPEEGSERNITKQAHEMADKMLSKLQSIQNGRAQKKQ